MNGSALLATRVGISGQKLHTNFVTLRNPEIISVPRCYWLLIQLRCSPIETHEYISFEYTPKKSQAYWDECLHADLLDWWILINP